MLSDVWFGQLQQLLTDILHFPFDTKFEIVILNFFLKPLILLANDSQIPSPGRQRCNWPAGGEGLLSADGRQGIVRRARRRSPSPCQSQAGAAEEERRSRPARAWVCARREAEGCKGTAQTVTSAERLVASGA